MSFASKMFLCDWILIIEELLYLIALSFQMIDRSKFILLRKHQGNWSLGSSPIVILFLGFVILLLLLLSSL